jgi:hypothetical protein
VKQLLKLKTVFFVFVLCASCTQSSSTVAAETVSLATTEKVIEGHSMSADLLTGFAKAAENDLKSALAQDFSPDSLQSYLIPHLSALAKTTDSCVSSAKSQLSADLENSFFDYQCDQIEGSVEASAIKILESTTHKLNAQLKSKTNQGATQSVSIVQIATVNSEGDIQIDKENKEQTDFGNEISKITQLMTLDYHSGGDVSLSGTLNTAYNGFTSESIIVTSEDLKVASCGFSDGQIEFHSSTRKVQITYKDCAISINESAP